MQETGVGPAVLGRSVGCGVEIGVGEKVSPGHVGFWVTGLLVGLRVGLRVGLLVGLLVGFAAVSVGLFVGSTATGTQSATDAQGS